MPELRIHIRGSFTRAQPLESRPVTLGRSPENDLSFPDDSVLSRRHLSIEPESRSWYALDLGSKNGTLLNGLKLTGRHMLEEGDTLTAGAVTLSYTEFSGALAAQTVIFTPAREEPTGSRTSVRINLKQAIGAGEPRVQALLDAGRELAGHRPLEELFPRILDLALGAVGAERGVLITTGNGGLQVRAARGEGFRISGSVRDRVLEGRESLLVVDVSKDEALMASHTIVSAGVRSLMAVPLQTEDKVIGLLYVDSSNFLKSFTQDDLTLATVLANIAAIRIEHARLIELAQAEKVLQHDLRQAAEIQTGLLPKASPVIPGYDIAAKSVPCRSVGGDYFDYVTLEGGKLGVLLGDVSGKGLPAALLLAGLQARVHVLAEQASQADDLMSKLNRRIAEAWPGNRFMTMCIIALDPVSGEFTYCNGGHNPPYLLRANGEVETLTTGGPVMGILKNAPYSAESGVLHPGDVLLLFTDGASEAEDPAGNDLGEPGVLALLKAAHGRSASDIVSYIYDAVGAFLAGGPAADDVTLLAIRRV
ncbi:MAG: SpoIIE family protein phosphatase [Candidatus Solibacter usitatus]|nr:SpoIIE family protein phosphatase [Candidatus Solibacter usitatus]